MNSYYAFRRAFRSACACSLLAITMAGGAAAADINNAGKSDRVDLPGNFDDLQFEFHGYLRAGLGASAEGGDQVCFQLPGAAAKYRLGNECEVYNEIFFGMTYDAPNSPATFTTNLRFANVVNGNFDFEKFDPALREAWVGARDFLDGSMAGAQVWAGKRFYRREDVHINDFYYWDASGTGAGLEDFNVGIGKAAVAYFRNTDDDSKEGSPNQTNGDAIGRLDLRLYDLKVTEQATLAVGGDIRFADTSKDSGDDIPGGWTLNGTYTQAGIMGGWNKLALQYGEGSGSSLSAYPSFGADEADSTFRVVDQLLVLPHRDVSMMFAGIYESKDNEDSSSDQEWLSLGMRSAYHFTDHFALVLEAGHDIVRPEDGDDRELTKITFAPTITAGRGFFDRPQIRAFVTYAEWNEAARDAGLEGTGDDTLSDVTFGIQFEHWW